MNKKVSIILPTFNGDRYIRESIDSCLEQTYGNLEVIVVEDGSDVLKEIISSYDDERIKYFRHEENKGISHTLNEGFSRASGEYLTWTSDDNIYMPDAIERMVLKLERNSGADFVYANFYEIDENGKVLKPVEVRPPASLNRVNYIGLCFLYKRHIYEEVGGYDPDLFLAEDYEYWLRIYHKGYRMKRIDKFLYYVRMHSGCLTCRYDRGFIEEQAQRARDKYIPEALRCYQHGSKAFYSEQRPEAVKLLWKSVLLDPFNYGAWRLIALLYVRADIVSRIRDVRNSARKGD